MTPERTRDCDHLAHGEPAQAVERVEAEPPGAEHVNVWKDAQHVFDGRGHVGTDGGADWHAGAANAEVGHGYRQHEERREVFTEFGVPRDQHNDETVGDNVQDDVKADVDRLHVGADKRLPFWCHNHGNSYVDNIE